MSSGTVTVSIPALPDVVHVLRAVASSIAARMHFGYEQIDDLRLAVDEACSHLLAVRPAADGLVMRIEPDGGCIRIVTIRLGEAEVWPPQGARQTLAWQVLTALTDEAAFERVPEGPAISFSKVRTGEDDG